jgi:hypothetical protein
MEVANNATAFVASDLLLSKANFKGLLIIQFSFVGSYFQAQIDD